MRRICLSVLLLGLGATAFAGGYRVALQGVRQASMGLTGVMHAKDASVAFFNPAGLAFVDAKVSIAAGGFGVTNNVAWQNPSTLESAETDSPMGTPIYFAASYRPLKDVTVGVSFTTPFGSTLKWPEDWAGRANITQIELKSYFIQPTVAFKFNDWFSVGAGFIYAMGEVNLQRVNAVAGNEVGLEINDTDAHGLGFNIGAYIKPSDRVNIGLAYRSKVDMKANYGEAIWSNVPTALSGSMPFTTDQFNAMLPLVSEFTAGLSYQATPKLTLAGEVSVHGWGSYRELVINLENTSTGETVESKQTKNYKDRAVWKIGAEYQATDLLALRLGYYFDEFVTPAEYWSPETPDATRHSVTGGVGLNFGRFNVDAMAQYIYGMERYIDNIETGFKGDIGVRAFIFGLGLSYNFN
ncbi:MAG: outer membrane protein transport protein [Weeksellaceae bacterium]|jgi:long-chain fatty acid transport protein|nr:outer membrane protein transport protein [Weeksellaceae bacterium]